MLEILDRLRFIPGGRERVIKHNQESPDTHALQPVSPICVYFSSSSLCFSPYVRNRQLFLSTTEISEGLKGDKVKQLINDGGTSRLYSFPAGTSSKCDKYTRARSIFFTSDQRRWRRRHQPGGH
jgi:hypothetical protein